MKRLILLLTLTTALFLAISAQSWAWMGVTMVGGGGVAAGCSTPSGTVMSEGFESCSADFSSGCDETWILNGDSATGNETLTGSPPTGSCSKGLLSDTSGESGERVYWDNGSAIDYSTTNVTIEFSLYINSATIDSNQNIVLLSWSGTNTGSPGTPAFISLRNNGGVSWQIYAYGGSISTLLTVTLETWYIVTLHLNTTAASSYIKLDSGAENNFTRADVSGRYLVIGSLQNESATEAVSFEIGYVTIN